MECGKTTRNGSERSKEKQVERKTPDTSMIIKGKKRESKKKEKQSGNKSKERVSRKVRKKYIKKGKGR